MNINDVEPYIADLRDLEDIIIGKKLGFGIDRTVFEFYFSDNKVIKIATGSEGRANNQIEYKLWDEIQNTKYDKWFAKCFGVSPNGKYLIQEKIKFKDISKYPKEIPHFFTDIKTENYGWTDKGKFVCCDYSRQIITNGITSRMKKVKWDI